MLSNKTSIRYLVHILASKGVEDVIISPGSRNAPLNISFNEHGGFRCRSVADERCAAFVALGMAQQNRKPAVITCTSGSAVLNFAPAISEAYYQRIPLLILTADRPDEWIDQGEGQSIRQREVYRNYTKASYHLPIDTGHPNDLRAVVRMVSEAIDCCTQGTPGPVHINIPFREPLYEVSNDQTRPPFIYQKIPTQQVLQEAVINQLKKQFYTAQKTLILCGLLPNDTPHSELSRQLGDLAQKGVVVLAESTSQLHHPLVLTGIDRLLTNFDKEKLRPDLLITIGHSFISKKIKLWLRQYPPTRGHWHISADGQAQDVFQCLMQHIPVSPTYFLGMLLQNMPAKNSNYAHLWQAFAQLRWVQHQQFMRNCEWSDMGVFKELLPKIPANSLLHLGNSSPVRYAQLFPVRGDLQHFANRGVSGIDGSTSTAIGAAIITGKPTTLITGDIAFFYDSNAFWQKDLPPHLRVILINNGGGGIFRLIPGPPSTRQLEDFFETRHQLNARGICATFGVAYYSAASYEELAEALTKFYAPQGSPAVLELFTPPELNAAVYRQYFEEMANLAPDLS